MRRGLMVCFLVVLSCTVQVGALQASPPSTQSEDAFVGHWKFNPDKSSNSGTERESINIEKHGSEYKFVYDWLAENGTELNYWFVTDMQGDCVPQTLVDGNPLASKSCMKRIDARNLVDDMRMLHDEYKVSKDGRTLTLHRSFKLPPRVQQMPKPHDQKLVFDRVVGDN